MLLSLQNKDIDPKIIFRSLSAKKNTGLLNYMVAEGVVASLCHEIISFPFILFKFTLKLRCSVLNFCQTLRQNIGCS